MTLPPAEVARLDSYAHHMRTLLCALFLMALVCNLIPREPSAFPAETVSVEVER